MLCKNIYIWPYTCMYVYYIIEILRAYLGHVFKLIPVNSVFLMLWNNQEMSGIQNANLTFFHPHFFQNPCFGKIKYLIPLKITSNFNYDLE